MKLSIVILFFFFLPAHTSFTQSVGNNENTPQNDSWITGKIMVPHTPQLSVSSLHPSFYDRKSEWPTIIKQFWGPGDPLSTKLEVFDLYSNYARANNATFLWNPVQWDTAASILRAKINDSTSRGEFSRILKDLSSLMRDGISSAYDTLVLNTPLNPGTPIIANGGGLPITNFGAGLTPLEDSSLLVYKVVPNHPLGLEPGDIILGYQGIPWSQLIHELLDGGIPHNLWLGAAPSAYIRNMLWSAGENWHLFDTIDVKKYNTGQILHLPLDSMVTLSVPSNYVNNEQLPVPGVTMPQFDLNRGAVTYGIIQGTNIGYIYVFHHLYETVNREFDSAIRALMNTDGLIIDIRFNIGGDYTVNEGISRLLNHPAFTLKRKMRCSPDDLFSLCPVEFGLSWDIKSDIGTYYDRPVAVLLGPGCRALGDMLSWQLSYVPNARMFGRSPQALYSGSRTPQPSYSGYSLRCANRTIVDYYRPDEPRWGTEYPLFEEIWHTPESVANGVDNVAARAVEWINNLSYAHDITTDRNYYSPGDDSVRISAVVENPNSHQISVRSYLKTLAGEMIDSVDKNVSTTGSEDRIGSFTIPLSEDYFEISINVVDITTGDSFATPGAARFTTAGPLTVDSALYTKGNYNVYHIRPFVQNRGTALMIKNIRLRITIDDPWVTTYKTELIIPDLGPGLTEMATSTSAVEYSDTIFPGYFNIKFELLSDGWAFWSDSLRLEILESSGPDGNLIISEFKLEQNFPNPFNAGTKINYQLPESRLVSLKIFDALGREAAVLVNEEKHQGTYEVIWNAENIPSGVYYYRLQAEDFIETKKMILMK